MSGLRASHGCLLVDEPVCDQAPVCGAVTDSLSPRLPQIAPLFLRRYRSCLIRSSLRFGLAGVGVSSASLLRSNLLDHVNTTDGVFDAGTCQAHESTERHPASDLGFLAGLLFARLEAGEVFSGWRCRARRFSQSTYAAAAGPHAWALASTKLAPEGSTRLRRVSA